MSYRGLHSPWLFSLFEKASKDKGPNAGIRLLRKQLGQDDREIAGWDPGAGSQAIKKGTVRVADIARHSPMPLRRAAFLANIARVAEVGTILELGTSLGLTSLALEAGTADHVRIITIEGNPGIAEIAAENFEANGKGRVDLHTGLFSEVLPVILQQYPGIGMVIIDGDHSESGTLAYYRLLSENLQDVIMVFDDIRWSDGMSRAWEAIISDGSDKVCLDFFLFGIIIRRKGLSGQYLRMRY